MSPKKLLIISAAGYMGGDVRAFVTGLPYLARNNYEMHIVSIPRGKVYDAFQQIPNSRLTTMELGGKDLHPATRLGAPIRLTEASLAAMRILGIARREHFDAIYSIDRTVSCWISYLVSVTTGLPLLLNAQISHYLDNSAMMRRVVRHTSGLTVSSSHMYKRFLPYVRNPEHMKIVFNAINLERYPLNTSGDRVRAEFGFGPDTPVVVLAGRLSPFKGQDDLIRAAAIIHKQRPDVQYLLAGSKDIPEYVAQLEQMIVEHNLQNNVRLLGVRSDLPELFTAATIGAMPSHEEPFGIVAIEAMAMQRPVVATRAGGVPDFIVDQEMGILVEPRDYQALAKAMLELINDPVRTKAMGRRARQQVEDKLTDQALGAKVVEFMNGFFKVETPAAGAVTTS